MLYKNIDIHNVAELVPTDDGVTWLRVPREVASAMEITDRLAKGSTGVELRFVIRSGEEAKIVLRSLSPAETVTVCQVFRGGIQGGWRDHELDRYIGTQNTVITVRRTEEKEREKLHRMAAEAGDEWDPEVIRVMFDRGQYAVVDVIGDVVPPRPDQMPRRTFLAYGSSITHGSNAIDAAHTWVSEVAHSIGYDFRNLGMAGSCAMEPAFAEYIAAEGEAGRWDLATLELGINVLGWEPEKIDARVRGMLTTVAGRNPDKPVVVISPFYSEEDFDGGTRADFWRGCIATIVQELALPNVTYISGLELLDDMRYISADLVHPNIYGVQKIADGLTTRLRSLIG